MNPFLYFSKWISFINLENLITVEVILMPKHPKRSASGTNIEDVKKQNQQAAQQNNQQQQQQQQQPYSTEFASETDVQKVKKQNQKSQQQKK